MNPEDETPEDDTIGTLIAWAEQRLRDAAIEAPRREVRLLLAHQLGPRAESRFLKDQDTIGQAIDVERFRHDVTRRASHEPLAYITGSQGFWTLDLAVSNATLIPRADSEAVIEGLLAQRPDRAAAMRMLDLGTGTGCLLLAALSEYPHSWGLGIDLSPQVCALAAANARAAGLAGRSAFCGGCWSDALSQDRGTFDLVLSNPPYIRSGEIAGLMTEVARFEPALALDGGADGLDAYRIILARLAGLLEPDGIAMLELGEGQLGDVQAIVAGSGLVFVAGYADLQGITRAIALRRLSGST